MTKLVEILEPDGRVTRAEFPDDASDAEIEAALGQPATPSAPQPAAATTTQHAPFASFPPDTMDLMRSVPDALSIPRWMMENPQLALEMIMQGVGTAAGIAPFTGPVGMAIGGAFGSLGGLHGARWLGSKIGLPGNTEQPTTGESVLAAIEGAAGPVVSSTARPAMKAFTGTGGRTFQKAGKEAEKAVEETTRRAAQAGESLDDTIAAVNKFGQTFDEKLVEMALDHLRKNDLGSMLRRGGELAGFGSAILGNPVAGLGFLMGGYALSGLQRAVALRLLESQTFKNWLASNAPFPKATSAAASLAALAADKGLTDTEKADIDALLGAIQFDSGLDPFSGERRRAGMPQRRARDPKTGKFVKGGVDHSALEELFRGGP